MSANFIVMLSSTIKYDFEQLSTDFCNTFGSTKYLDITRLKQLQHSGWQGEMCLSMRSISWRVWLGLLPQSMILWPQKMEQDYQEYEELKTVHLPDINKVQADPLAGMFSGQVEVEEEEEGRGGGWDAYYKVRSVVGC